MRSWRVYRNHEILDSIRYPVLSTLNFLPDLTVSSLVPSNPNSTRYVKLLPKLARILCYPPRIWRGSRIHWVGWRIGSSRGSGRRGNRLRWRIGRKKRRRRGKKGKVLSTSKRVSYLLSLRSVGIRRWFERGVWCFCTAEKKKLFLKAKFDELSQDKRKLGKAMDKKRRKTSQKEKKQMPRTR